MTLAALLAVSCEKDDLPARQSLQPSDALCIEKGNGNGHGNGNSDNSGRGNNGRGGEHASPNARGNGVSSQRGEGPLFGAYTITITVGTEGMGDGGTVPCDNGGTGGGTEAFEDGEIVFM